MNLLLLVNIYRCLYQINKFRYDFSYYASQIANAVVVAKYVGATLVLPEIRGTQTGHKR